MGNPQAGPLLKKLREVGIARSKAEADVEALTDEMRNVMNEARAANVPVATIAEQAGVTRTTVYNLTREPLVAAGGGSE